MRPVPVAGDLAGQVCVVTGASSGIGREAARELARLGAHVVLAARSAERTEEARAAIAAEYPNAAPEIAVVDLASQRSTRAFTESLRAKHPRIDVLINNAGTWSSRRRLSEDGIEITWATNVLAYHLVLAGLLPALRKAEHPRVINVASRLAHGLDLDDVQFERRRYRGVDAYAQSKQADRMLTWAWARRVREVQINAMHPGGVNTGLFAKGGGLTALAGAIYAKVWGRTVAEGADTIVWLAADEDASALRNEFMVNRRVKPCAFRDPQAEDALFDLCESMTGRPAAAVLR